MRFRLLRSRWFMVVLSFAAVIALTALTWKVTRSHAGGELKAAAGRPRLELDGTRRDLGVVTPREKMSLEFQLRNPGARNLTVSNLRSSCGCAPATIDKNPIPPGETATIAVSFQTPEAAGLVGHAVLFETDDPDHAAVQLGFQVMVQRPVESTPPNLYVGVMMCGQQVAHELELCTTAGDAFAVTEVQPSASWIRAEPIASTAPHRRRFRITVTGGLKPGKFSESLQFRTTCPKQEVVRVPVTGETVAGFKINPDRLLLGSAPAGSVVDAQLLITEITPETASVNSIAVAGKDWDVIAWKAEKTSGTMTRINFKIRVPDTAGYKRTTLHVHPRMRSEPYEILISCLVQGKMAAEN